MSSPRTDAIEQWPALPPLDLIFARNVMMYFDVSHRREILDQMHRLLHPDGHLGRGIVPVAQFVRLGFTVFAETGRTARRMIGNDDRLVGEPVHDSQCFDHPVFPITALSFLRRPYFLGIEP